MKKNIVSLLLGFSLLLGITACGGTATTAATTAAATTAAAATAGASEVATTQAESADAATSAAATEAGDEAMTIGAVVMNTSGEWFAEVISGMEKKGKELGVNVQIVNSNNDVATEADNMDAFIAQKVNSIAMGPISADGSVAAIDRAVNANIPVVCWNTTANTPNMKHFVGVDNKALGKQMGEWLSEYVTANYPEGIKLSLLINTRYDAGIQRTEGFKEGIQAMVDSGKINVLTEVEAEFKEEGLDATDRIMTGFPETEFVWCWNQTSMEGAVAALAGNDKVKVCGTDMAISFAKMMLEPNSPLLAVCTQQPAVIGGTAIEAAYKVAKGDSVDAEILVPLELYTSEDAASLQKYIDDRADLVTQ